MALEFVIDDTNPNIRVVKLNNRCELSAGDSISVTVKGETAAYEIQAGKSGNGRVDALITEE